MFDLFPHRIAQSYIADRLREAERARLLAKVPSRRSDRLSLLGLIGLHLPRVAAQVGKNRAPIIRRRPPCSCSRDGAMASGKDLRPLAPPESPVAGQRRCEAARSVASAPSAARTVSAKA